VHIGCEGWRVVRIGVRSTQSDTSTMTSLRCALYDLFDISISDPLTQTNSTGDPGPDLPPLNANHYLLQELAEITNKPIPVWPILHNHTFYLSLLCVGRHG
jgi:hypothetical protein